MEQRLNDKPVFVYTNSIVSRDQIRKDTNGLSGIYLWFSTINGKCYMGNGIDLYRRIKTYFQPVYQKRSYPIYNTIIIGKSNSIN